MPVSELPYVTPEEEEFRGYCAPVSALPAGYDAWRLAPDDADRAYGHPREDERRESCAKCKGYGQIQLGNPDAFEPWVVACSDCQKRCFPCRGSGRFCGKTCFQCNGRGHVDSVP